MTRRQLRHFLLALIGILLTGGPSAVMAAESPHRGRLYLVGIGPGDAELLTLKAARILREADAVFCFPFLKDEVARYARSETISVVSSLLMRKFVGQNAENVPAEMLESVRRSKVEMARFAPRIRELVAAGKTVVLADAGDPTIFGPWSWATEAFADLRPQVIPGLSSFNAANAALGHNLTCGGAVLLTAGDDLGQPDEQGRLRTTLVIFTHHAKVQDLVPRLAARYPSDTPVALVCEASYPTEEVVTGTLATILEKLRGKNVPHLYLLYVGDALSH